MTQQAPLIGSAYVENDGKGSSSLPNKDQDTTGSSPPIVVTQVIFEPHTSPSISEVSGQDPLHQNLREEPVASTSINNRIASYFPRSEPITMPTAASTTEKQATEAVTVRVDSPVPSYSPAVASGIKKETTGKVKNSKSFLSPIFCNMILFSIVDCVERSKSIICVNLEDLEDEQQATFVPQSENSSSIVPPLQQQPPLNGSRPEAFERLNGCAGDSSSVGTNENGGTIGPSLTLPVISSEQIKPELVAKISCHNLVPQKLRQEPAEIIFPSPRIVSSLPQSESIAMQTISYTAEQQEKEATVPAPLILVATNADVFQNVLEEESTISPSSPATKDSSELQNQEYKFRY